MTVDQAPSIRRQIYVAGPISLGNIRANVVKGIYVGVKLLRLGYAPYIPHLSHYATPAALVGTKDYERWMETNFSMLSKFEAGIDVLLRLPGKSAGADREVAFAQTRHIIVCYSVKELVQRYPPVPFPSL